MFNKIWGYLAVAGGIAMAILYALGMAKKSGKTEAENDSLKQGAAESETYRNRVDSAHNAGRVLVDARTDPHNRANRVVGED